jgi:GDP-4-dehydro-6-deoxy-D-mannose reductase
MMRALVTGISGFAGSHLARELLGHGYDVHGTHLPGEDLSRLGDLGKKIKLHPLDFLKEKNLYKLLGEIKPNYIFHLAAQPSVGFSFKSPEETIMVNFMGTFHLLQAARKLRNLKGLLTVTSSDIYGVIKRTDLPLTEEQKLQPVSPYGVSKAACDLMGYQYFKNYGLPVVRARSFNHSGPGQARGFVVTDLCYQIAALENSRRKPVIKMGNLKAKRDISDVRDIVRGYRLALEKGKAGEVYHLCSGKTHSVSELLKKALRMTDLKIEVKIDPKLARPTEVPILIGDASKAERQLSYKRRFTIDDTLKDCLDYFRSLQGGKCG